MRGPVVERVAPELAGGAEVVGRHAGDGQRPAVVVELEQLLVGPDVGAVEGDEDRHVADDLHAGARWRMPCSAAHWRKNDELHEALACDRRCQPRARRRQRVRLAQPQRRRPVAPGAAALLVFERQKRA